MCSSDLPELGRFVPSVLDVLTLDGDRIARVDGFLTIEMLRRLDHPGRLTGAELFARCGLPADVN